MTTSSTSPSGPGVGRPVAAGRQAPRVLRQVLDRVPGRRGVDPDRFAGATVLVTGASSGIGAELARQAARTAATIVLVARRRDRLESLADELTALDRGGLGPVAVDVRPADLSTREGVDALAREVLAAHEVDVLVNDAGFGDYGLFEQADPDTLERMVAVDVLAPTLLTRHLLPGMVARGRGGVLVVGSSAGQVPTPGAAVYGASKHYVDGLCTALRGELTGTGVTITQVAPGPVETEFDAVSGMGPLTHLAEPTRISAAQCAREAWAGFCAGRAMVYPGAAVRAGMHANELLPDVARRPVLAVLGRRLRARTGATGSGRGAEAGR